MKTITVRRIGSILSDKLKQVAKDEGRSVNQVVIDTREETGNPIKIIVQLK